MRPARYTGAMAQSSESSPSPRDVIGQWLERDLSAEVASLPGTYERDGLLEHATGVLASGRNLLLVGESGVGKSALVVELARRLPTLESMGDMRLAAVLQLSVGLRLSRLRKNESIFEALAALMEALGHAERPVIPFFRDGDLLYQTGIAAQLDSFCLGYACR